MYTKFDNFVLSNGRSFYDHYVYYMKYEDGRFMYLLIYVDDILIVSKSMNVLHELKNMLKIEFEMKDLSPKNRILGMGIIRN